MKKYILICFIFVLMVLFSCKDVIVFYPIPLKSEAIFLIQTSGGSYNIEDSLDAQDLWKDVLAKLNKQGLSTEDIEQIKLEGIAYTILHTDNPNAVVNGELEITYATQTEIIIHLQDINFGQILNEPQVNALTPGGVALLNQALNNLINSQGNAGVISVESSGNLTAGTTGEVKFTMLVEFTITSIVKKKQEIFDPLG